MKVLTYKEAKQRKPLLKWYVVWLIYNGGKDLFGKEKAISKEEAYRNILDKMKGISFATRPHNKNEWIYYTGKYIVYYPGKETVTFGKLYLEAEEQK